MGTKTNVLSCVYITHSLQTRTCTSKYAHTPKHTHCLCATLNGLNTSNSWGTKFFFFFKWAVKVIFFMDFACSSLPRTYMWKI